MEKQKRHFLAVDFRTTMSLLRKLYVVLFLMAFIFFAYQFLKEAHFCPSGSIWTGQQCSGTGILPIK